MKNKILKKKSLIRLLKISDPFLMLDFFSEKKEGKKGQGKKEIEWRPNRAVFFSRSEKETWHSYEGDGVSNRLALVYNLMTNDIKGVCKAENKIYFFTKFRFLINPYLHKYFKFTI